MAGNPSEERLRLASYNIRKARGLDGRRDPHRSAAVIGALGADVVAVQEADRRLGPRPAALTRKALMAESDLVPLEEVARSHVSLGWHGNAVLVREGFRASQVERLDLTSPDPRGAVLVEFSDPVPLRIVAVHLSLMRSARRRQLEQIRAVLAARPDMPTVVLGDFNEWRAVRGLEPLRDGFSVVSPGKSFHAARPVAALDRFAHDPSLVLEDAGVDEGKLARVASDHLPVWAEFRLGGQAGFRTNAGT